MRALVVEQSGTLRCVLHGILARRGFDVVEAGDGPQAIALLRRMGDADLVLASWELDGSMHPTLLSQLRAYVRRDVAIWVLSPNEPDDAARRQALMAGANDWLLTPFTSIQMEQKLLCAGLLQ